MAPYHPAYGLPQAHRDVALETAANAGAAAAALRHNVSERSIKRWQDDLNAGKAHLAFFAARNMPEREPARAPDIADIADAGFWDGDFWDGDPRLADLPDEVCRYNGPLNSDEPALIDTMIELVSTRLITTFVTVFVLWLVGFDLRDDILLTGIVVSVVVGLTWYVYPVTVLLEALIVRAWRYLRG